MARVNAGPSDLDPSRLYRGAVGIRRRRMWQSIILVVRSEGRGESVMSDDLQRLIDAARRHPFTEDEREAQRRSFAYGNTKIENDLITREMIDEADERIKAELQAQ